MSFQEARCYLRTLAITITVLLAPIITFNLIVDPFSMFQVLDVQGFNDLKPEFFSHVRMTKAHKVRVFRPRGIILGTSRAEYGLDPEYLEQVLPNSSPWYNLGLTSCRIYECLRYLQHANAMGGLKQVVIGLDCFMFDDSVKNEKDFEESRLAGPGNGNGLCGWIHDIVVSLASFDALEKSISTIMGQDKEDIKIYYPNGMRNDERAWMRIRKKGGYRKVDMEIAAIGNMQGKRTPNVKENGIDEMTLSMDYFRRIVSFCRLNHIDLRLFISPVHARFEERMIKLGKWEMIEKWKRELVKVLTSEGSEIPRGKPYPLWDFSGYNSITTESFPLLGDSNTQMRWFWESTHYKKETGNLVLNRIFHHTEHGHVVPDDFGILLTPDNIERVFARIRSDRKEYVRTHRRDVNDIWGEMISPRATSESEALDIGS